MRTLKVFVSETAEMQAVLARATLVEKYDAFVVVQAEEAAARKLARQFPLEDISAQYAVPLAGGEADPLAAATALPAAAKRGIRAAKAAPSEGAHHHLVQFIGPIKPAWLTALKRSGATLRHATAGFAYVVRADGQAMMRIRALAFVRWAGHLPHADRISPVVAGTEQRTLPRRRALPGALNVELFDAADLPRVAQAAQGIGFEVMSQNKRARTLAVNLPADDAQRAPKVQALSAVHGVRFITERSLPRTSNNVAAGILRQRQIVAAAPAGLGLTGEGEIVAVCDTGLDTGDAQTIHPDFAGRVVAIKSYPIGRGWRSYVTNPGADDGAADVDSGHGTHVAGSVLGDGSASANGPVRMQGMAPKAKLVFQAVEQRMLWRPGAVPNPSRQRYALSGIPDDLEPLFRFAYDHGARIHNNSWGGGEPGAYDAQCGQFDDFVWRHKDMCFVIAAGNDGSDTGGAGLPADGRINPGSVTSPGTAKNCITVGASENLRPEFNRETYGRWWADDFPVAPFKNAAMADKPNSVVAFSSRGPTNDGRNKPEVVAPGTFIASVRSTQLAPNNFAWGSVPGNRMYFHMGGTSMAAPLVAGCVALLRQYLRTQRQIASPSAALLKAVLIVGALRLPGTASVGTLVDDVQGFGRVDMARSLSRLLVVQEGAGLSTGQMKTYTVQVARSGRTLRVALAYSDAPGSALVNNLNLIVIAPDGTRHVGNQGRGRSVGFTLDSRNNVEVVQAAQAARGQWTVQVIASNVPQGPQDHALAAVLI